MSSRFNFDDFADQITDALEENEAVMRPLRPGQIGAVSVLGYEAQPDPELPPAA